MATTSMSGTLHNLEQSGFVATPEPIATWIAQTLLVPAAGLGPITILDPTCGAGDLLAPFLDWGTAQLHGVEIEQERALVAYDRFRGTKRRHMVTTSDILQVQYGANSFSAIVANPPYMQAGNKRRMEEIILQRCTPWLQPDGVMVAILPARSAWTRTLRLWWATHFTGIQCWQVPEPWFAQYTQIIVAGRKRATPAVITDDAPELRQWGYHDGWDGTPPPVMGTEPVSSYIVPSHGPAPIQVHYLAPSLDRALNELRAIPDETWSASLYGRMQQGSDQTWLRDIALQPAMPPVGEAHIASLVITGVLDHQPLQGPDGAYVALASSVQRTWKKIDPDPEQLERERLKGVVRLSIEQLADDAQLRVINLATGEAQHVTDEEVVTFLGPWLPRLTQHIATQQRPLYRLDPSDAAIRTVMQIGQDRQLAGARHAGLVAPQQHIVYAAHALANRGRRVMIQGEPGTGKTRMLIALAWLMAQQPGGAWRRRYRRAWQGQPPTCLPVLISTPYRVTNTWLNEIAHAMPAGTACATVITDAAAADAFMQACRRDTEHQLAFGIVPQSKTRAFKRRWQPALLTRTIDRRRREGYPQTYSQPWPALPPDPDEPATLFYCPHCFHILKGRLTEDSQLRKAGVKPPAVPESDSDPETDDQFSIDLVVTDREYFQRARRFCLQCGSPLYVHCRANVKAAQAGMSLADAYDPHSLLARRYTNRAALVIVDESHNGRGRNTDIAHCIRVLSRCGAFSAVWASGTQYGGTLSDFFHYFYAYKPSFWQRLGFEWNDEEAAMQRYGVTQQISREKESTSRVGSGLTQESTTTVPAPGISATLLPQLNHELLFISTRDVGVYMPPRIEIPVIVPLHDDELDRQAAQQTTAWRKERDLAAAYQYVTSTLQELAGQYPAAQIAQGTIPRWFATLPCAAPFTVTATSRTVWGKVTASELLLTTPELTPTWRYPLERALHTHIADQIARDRTTMVYVEQTELRSMPERLMTVLAEFNPWTLPDRIEPPDREDAIRVAAQAGHRVLIVPYRRVAEGINLQDCIDTIMWFEMAMNLILLEQASRRAWRLGRVAPVEIYYFAYGGTATYQKLCSLGLRSGAAAAFAGDPPRGALAEHVGTHRTLLARVATQIADADLVRQAFSHRNRELAAELQRARSPLGYEDTLEQRILALIGPTISAPTAPLPRPQGPDWAELRRRVLAIPAPKKRRVRPISAPTLF